MLSCNACIMPRYYLSDTIRPPVELPQSALQGTLRTNSRITSVGGTEATIPCHWAESSPLITTTIGPNHQHQGQHIMPLGRAISIDHHTPRPCHQHQCQYTLSPPVSMGYFSMYH